MMFVNVSPNYFLIITEELQRYEALGDIGCLFRIYADLRVCHASYGGDFDESLSRLGVPIEIRVVYPE